MQLSNKAIKELQDILAEELGVNTKKLEDSELNDFGVRMLHLTSIVLKKQRTKSK